MAAASFEPVGPDIFRFRDTCNVYAVRSGDRAVLIDFGRGRALGRLAEIGVARVDAVLVTHFHRDQIQGLQGAVDSGIEIYVPPLERDLIAGSDGHWHSRPLSNDYDLRQDRFSLLHSVAVTGWVKEYAENRFGTQSFYALPTPGHTVGSLSYLVERQDQLFAFTGDLVYGTGQVWSLAATQWSYTGIEGLVSTMSSCHELGLRQPTTLFPSHGEPVSSPLPALEVVQERLQILADNRTDLVRPETYKAPWVELSPHLLRNRASIALSHALLSDSGTALLIDFGYDICAGMLAPSDRHARRPLLTSLRQLKDNFGVERVEVAVPTHYHDDHVAGFNLLAETHGTQVWTLPEIADILGSPRRYDLPCLWHDAIPVHRRVQADVPVRWREYELCFYRLPGHTLYANAIAFEVDGRKVLATGDQQTGGWANGRNEVLNYQYRNRFRIDDFVDSALLYQRLRPDLMISGHWPQVDVTDEYLDVLLEKGKEIARVHREVLPLDEVDFGAEGFGARIEPYTCEVSQGKDVTLAVTVKNPFNRAEHARVQIVVPPGWAAHPISRRLSLEPLAEGEISFRVSPAPRAEVRARVAVELWVGQADFGQQAEALITVL